MTWRDNLRGASTENGFIIAGGSEMSLVPQNLNWHDYYMNCFTENGVKIANLKEPVEQVSSLPATGKEGELCYVTGSNPGLYFYDGSSWVSLSTGGGSGPSVVQSIGNSTTDVMSQNAVTTMVFKDPGAGTTVKIGNNADSITSGVAIGYSAKATEENAVAVGCDTIATGVSGATALGFSAEATAGCAAAVGGDAKADASYSVALGYKANTNGKVGAVALGAKSFPTRDGEINVGTTDTNLGYANTNLRVISGVFGGVSASDAATKGQLDAIAIKNAGTPTTSTVGMVGQLLEDTTNAKLYQCTAVNSGIGVDATAGLTSQLTDITFTISDLSKLNSKISAAATLSAGSYMVRRGASLAYYISNINDSTSLGSLGNIIPTAFANALGVTPAPANIWSQTASHLANGAPVFSFTLVDGGQVTYTWAEVGGGPTVVQTTGTSTTDVMSQNAVTNLLFNNNNTQKVQIGDGAGATNNLATALGASAHGYGNQSVAVGFDALASGMFAVSVGAGSAADATSNTAMGYYAHAQNNGEASAFGASSTATGVGALALGAYSTASSIGAISFTYCNDGGGGVVNFGPFNTSYGYSGTNYRLLTGVHDAQGDHDAVTLGQLNALITQLQNLGLNVSLQGAANNNNQNPGGEPGPEEPGPEEPGPEIPPEEPTEEPVEG